VFGNGLPCASTLWAHTATLWTLTTPNVTLLQRWAAAWSDLVAFEIVPVVPGKDAGAALADQL
jgi:hypothetical protein